MHPTVQGWGSWTGFADDFSQSKPPRILAPTDYSVWIIFLPRAMEGDHEQHHLQWEPRRPCQMFLDTGGIGLKVYVHLYDTLESVPAQHYFPSLVFLCLAVRCLQSGCKGNKRDSLVQRLANCRSIHGHERHHSHSTWGHGCDTIFTVLHGSISCYIWSYSRHMVVIVYLVPHAFCTLSGP